MPDDQHEDSEEDAGIESTQPTNADDLEDKILTLLPFILEEKTTNKNELIKFLVQYFIDHASLKKKSEKSKKLD